MNDMPVDDFHQELEDTVLNLSAYLEAVSMVVKETFNHHVWIKAEIRNLSTKGGHYYFELAEKDDDGKIIASCRGNLWRYQAERVLKKFVRATGVELSRDLTVMLKVTANLHPQYGFSINITDIDPTYTVGDLAKQYTAMLERLIGEGLTQTNKQVPLPLDIEHVLVIAPQSAAGLGDFRAEADKLQQARACHFHYHNATFQGNHAPREIRHAILAANKKHHEAHNKPADLLVIIRGGGAVGDLAYLNDYELAALVAEQSMPVWVGIGHERDRVILDEVAHTSFDTPSKVINAIIHHLGKLVAKVRDYHSTIEAISKQQIQLLSLQSDRHLANIKKRSVAQLSYAQKTSQHNMLSVERQAQNQLQQARMDSKHNIDYIQQDSKSKLTQADRQTKLRREHIELFARSMLKQAEKDSRHLREAILLQSPMRVLQQGYSIVKDSTKKNIITSAAQLESWQEVTIEFKDGSTQAVVKK